MNTGIDFKAKFAAKHSVASKKDSNSKQVTESNSGDIKKDTVESDCKVD
jgi:hypothetical protein